MYHLLLALLRPYVLLHLLLGAGLLAIWFRSPAVRRWLLLPIGAWLCMWAVSSPVTSYFLLGSLEWAYPPADDPASVDAIVVLSGNHLQPDRVRRQAEPGSSTMTRCRYAAQLYHAVGPLHIIVTGGKAKASTSGPGCAALMRDLLLDLRVEDRHIIVENASRSTYENAVETRKHLDSLGINTIALVTDASHMRRAVLCFQKQNITVIPAPTGHRATELDRSLFNNLLPSPAALEGCHTALHEWLGLAWYRFKNRI
jgi:uncharacterized SAM-binding protein YcdF (DUF218 family)